MLILGRACKNHIIYDRNPAHTVGVRFSLMRAALPERCLR